MIDLSKYDKIIDALKRGETARVNHRDCKAGQDTRRRLYLTRPAGSPNVVLGFCHNCQTPGIRRVGNNVYRDDFENSAFPIPKLPKAGANFEIPSGMVPCGDDWPTDAHAWRLHCGLSRTACLKAQIQYDPNTHRVYLPQYDTMIDEQATGELIGYQLRNLGEHGAKYLSVVRDTDNPVSTLCVGIPHRDWKGDCVKIGVVVEDLASGLAIIRASKRCTNGWIPSVTVNYGTKVNPDALHKNADIDIGLVWLDNDSASIIEQAEKIGQVWRMLADVPIDIEHVMPDPKSQSGLIIIDRLENLTRNG